MGNTLGCVRKQQEAAEADRKKTPLTPRKKIKFRRFRRTRKAASHAAGEAEGRLPATPATLRREGDETRLYTAAAAGELSTGAHTDPDLNPVNGEPAEHLSSVLQKPVSLGDLSDLPTKAAIAPEKSIDVHVGGSGESTQRVLSVRAEIQPVGEHVIPFEEDVCLLDQVTAGEERCDPAVQPAEAKMKGDLICPAPVSGEEDITRSLNAGNKIIANIPEAAGFDSNEIEADVESPILSKETPEVQLDWEGSNATRSNALDKLCITLHSERMHGKNGQSALHRENEALEEEAELVRQSPLKRDFTVELQISNTLFSSGYGSNLPSAEINESESGRTSSRDFELSSSIPDGDTLSISENEFGLSTSNECDDISLGQIVHLSQELISEIYVSGESGDMSAKEKLLLWTQKLTEGYSGLKCSNFTSSWSDGKVFNAIIHKYRPDLIDMEKVSIQSNQENLEQAFAVAEALGVTRLLDPEDVDVPSPDEKSVLTYVSSIYESFPKVPEGGEGISANEVDSKWQEYQNKVNYLFQWIRQHITLMSDKAFPHNPVELKALYNEYVHFKETELPAKEVEKAQIQHLYKLFEVWIEFGRILLPQGFHPNDVEEEWGKLIIEMLDREKALRPAVERLELLLQIANKIQNGALNCEEKLTLAKNTLQADAAHLESSQQFQYETEVVMYLEECERLIRQLQIDVQILRDEKYYQVEQIVMKIIKLQDELVTLRLECTNLYRKGHFISSTDHLQPLNLTATELTTDVGPSTLHITSLTGFKKPMTRSELIAVSSTQDEGSLRFVYELLAWVEEVQVRLDRAEWGTDLPNVEMQLETHKTIHTAVEELDSSLKEAKIYEGQISSNFKTSYSDTLSKLEVQYLKLLETSRLRLRHLLSLHSFVSKVTTELIWLNEKEEEELAYDWSDNNTNISAKKEYFIELKKELEQKQMVIKSHQETGEQLSLENHPARQTVEAYSAALQTQWQWIKQLCCCVEQHVKDNTTYFQFLSDVKEAEQYLRNLQETIRRKYKCDRTSSLSKLEDLLQDSMDEKEQLIKYKSCIAGLVGRAKTIVQLKPRNPDNVLKATIPIKAICDYRQIEPLGTMQHPSTGKVTGSGPQSSLHYHCQYHFGIGQQEITVCKNDECVLEDNSHRTKWKVISPTGNEAMVPSVCFTIPAPNQEAIDTGSRVEQMYQNVMALWHQLHINMKSVVSWNYLVKDIETIHTWNKDTFKTLETSEQQQVMKNLQVHYEDFLEDSQESQVFSIADRLRLEEEVDSCKDHYEQLLVTMETEEKDETLSKTCISELQNICLRLEKYKDRLIRRLQTSVEGDAIQENTFRMAQQEHMQQELNGLKSDLDEVTKKCESFFCQSPSAASIPVLRSELDLVVQKMDQVHSLSSTYMDKLKTVDVMLKSSQGAEMLVKMYEMKLSEEDVVPVDLQAIEEHRSVLQQWLSDVTDKQEVFSSLEEEMQRAQMVCKHLFEMHSERSLDLERYQEKAVQLKDRWRNVQTQIETRESELSTIEELLKNYRGCHQSLIDWIEETTAQQGKMEPGKAEDTKILSEQLSQQTALVAEIENNQIKLDECQNLSKQYSAAVKDYELQLMTYRAFVESHQKSPVKRRRMHSSSDVITQEFMDLRTQYTALVTLTTQHVKYISDALRRLEEEEKIVEEEKQEHVEKMKELLGWVLNTDQMLKNKTIVPEAAGLETIEQSFCEQQAITEELNAKKDQVAEAIKTAQIFLAKHGNRISPEEQQQVMSQLNTLKETYGKLCDQSAEELQRLQNKLTHEVQRKENETIAGVIDLGTVEIFSIFRAMQKGFIDQDTGLALLQIQVINSGLLIPETCECLSAEQALERGAIDDRTAKSLKELQAATQLLKSTNFKNNKLLPVAAAVEENKIEETVGLKILELQLSYGLGNLPTAEAVDLERAFQQGLISASLHSKMKARQRIQKGLIDPNTGEKLGLSELMQRCIVDKETGLTLFPIKQLAGGMICLKSGRKVSIFRAIQEGLIDQQVMVRLLETQLFAGGIVDPRTGHRLTVDEAVRYNLIDHDIACSILIRQIQMGGIIDPVSAQRLTLDEAVQRDLMTSRSALVVLESQLSFKGLLWPKSGEVLPVASALQQGLVSTELAHTILKKRPIISGLYFPETTEVLSWEESIEQGILDDKVAEVLKSIRIPDAMPNIKEVGFPSIDRLNWRTAVGMLPSSNLKSLDADNSTEVSDSQMEEERLLSYLMTQSYMNVHNGNRLLLIDAKLNDVTKEFIKARVNTAVLKIEAVSEECNNEYDTIMDSVELYHPDKLILEQSDSLKASDKLEPGYGMTERQSDGWIKESRNSEEIPFKKNVDFPAYEERNDKTEICCRDIVANEQPTVGREQNPVEYDTGEKEKLKILLGKSKSEANVISDESNIAEKSTKRSQKANMPSIDTETSLYAISDVKLKLPSQDQVGNKCFEEEAIDLQTVEPFHLPDSQITSTSSVLGVPTSALQESQCSLISNNEAKAVVSVNRIKPTSCDIKNGISQGNVNGTSEGKIEELLSCGKNPERNYPVKSFQYQELAIISNPAEDSLDDDSTLNLLIGQLQSGGVIDEQTGQRLALNEAVAKGVLQSHTALKLMEKLGIFSGFFDPQTCETLTVAEAVDEGLVNEQLIQKILNSEKVICGIIYPGCASVHSVKDAAKLGLLDQETAARILEGQVVSGGIVDLKRGKQLSVTLASKMGLVDKVHQDNLINLEKATKGKGSDEKAKLRMISLQMEMNGIVDPQTKEHITVVEAKRRGIIDKEAVFNILKKQVAFGGINHHLSGMRLSVTDAVKCGLIDQDVANELIEVEKASQHACVRPKIMQPITLSDAASLGFEDTGFVFETEEVQASSGKLKEPVTSKSLILTQTANQEITSALEKAVSSPDQNQGIVDPEQCMVIPYSELIKKGKIDLESGQRYMEARYFTGVIDELTGKNLTVAEAVKTMKVDPVPAMRLLQAQADSGGIVEGTTGNRMTLKKAAECELLDDNMLKVIVTNQLLSGGIIDTLTGDRVPLTQAAENGLISHKTVEEIQSNAVSIGEYSHPDPGIATETVIKPIVQSTSFKEMSSNKGSQVLSPGMEKDDQMKISDENSVISSKNKMLVFHDNPVPLSSELLLEKILDAKDSFPLKSVDDTKHTLHQNKEEFDTPALLAPEAIVYMDTETNLSNVGRMAKEEMELDNYSMDCFNIVANVQDVFNLEMTDAQQFMKGKEDHSANEIQMMISNDAENKSDQRVYLTMDHEVKEFEADERKHTFSSRKGLSDYSQKEIEEMAEQKMIDEISGGSMLKNKEDGEMLPKQIKETFAKQVHESSNELQSFVEMAKHIGCTEEPNGKVRELECPSEDGKLAGKLSEVENKFSDVRKPNVPVVPTKNTVLTDYGENVAVLSEGRKPSAEPKNVLALKINEGCDPIKAAEEQGKNELTDLDQKINSNFEADNKSTQVMINKDFLQNQIDEPIFMVLNKQEQVTNEDTENDRDKTEEVAEKQPLYSKQQCLEHDENLVSYLSHVLDIEVRLKQQKPVGTNPAMLLEQLHLAEGFETELEKLSVQIDQELTLVNEILEGCTQNVPDQLLKALEKDSKSLQISFTSVREVLKTWHGVLTDILATKKELKESLSHTKTDSDDVDFAIQQFNSESAQDLSPQQSGQLHKQLNEPCRSFIDTSVKTEVQTEAPDLQFQDKVPVESKKTRQEQQEECKQKLDELGTWLTQTANVVANHQVAVSECDLPALHEQQNAIQALQKDMQSRAAVIEDVIKATEHLLEENQGKLDTEELAKVETKLLEVKAQHKVLSQSAEKLQKQVDSALTKAVQQESEKAKAEEELEENKVKIDGLLEWLSALGQQTASYSHRARPREERNEKHGVCINEDEFDALGNGLQLQDQNDVMDTLAGMDGNLNQQQQALKEHHEMLLSQQQAFVLATQSAQSFLDKHGHNLLPEEKKQLQSNLNDLKEQYETALLHADTQLKHIHALQEELQKFLKDHGEFEAWLIQSEYELEEIKAGEMDSNSLQIKLQKQKCFSEDVISHKGDLRYITISGQKVLDAADAFAEANANEDVKTPIDPSVTSTLVKEKLEDANNRYSMLHSKCTKLGTHLANMLEKYEHFHEIVDELNMWLKSSEATGDRLLLETISSDPENLQKQLEDIKVLQGDVAEHQVSVEKLQKAANSLMLLDDDLVPNQDQIRQTTDSIAQRYKSLSKVVSEHNEKLQVSIAQSQNVQEGLDNLLNWLEGVEKSLKNQDNLPLSSAAFQDALAQNTKLKQDIASHQSSINAIQDMVHGFIENTDGATASSLQEKLEQLNSHVQAVCIEQQEKEEKLRKLLPKMEQFEKLVQDVGQFMESKSQSLAAGGDPNKDIAHFSQKMLDASTEMVKQRGDLQALQQLAEELTAFGMSTEKNQLMETVKDLTRGYKKLELNIKKREEEAISCQQSLSEFTSLVESIRKWLKETEANIPNFESAFNTDMIEKQIQEVTVLLEDWSAKSPQIQEINHKGTELESLIMEITSPDTTLLTSKTELAEIQQNVSDVNHNYKTLGNMLKECQDHLMATLNQMQEVQEETASIMNWLELKEQTLTSLSSSSIKTQAMKEQVEQNKAYLAELEQNAGKIDKLKGALKDLLKKNPDSPEAKKWTEMLEHIESKWAHANQAITERQQKLEESADLLSSFQNTESQLSPWLSEKELMMSVLGPLSIDPNMLRAQKQQVQFMLKEFETRKPQYEQLNQAADGILCAAGDVSPSDSQVRDQHRAINEKWDNLTHQLSSRSNQIDQATAKSTEYQELLQRLSDKVRILNNKLNSQSVISTQPDIVKQQLEEISEIRSDLEQQKEQIEEAQNLCDDLSSLIGEQYLKDELRKRLDAVLMPFNGLEERAGDRINQLQTTLASSQQFQQTFDELRLWLDGKCSEHTRKPLVSANLDTLQSQISEQEEFQKSLNQHSGSYEMILAEGESLVRSAQTGEEKMNLQSQLSTLKGQWDELWKQAAGRHSKLKDCVQKAQKYRQYMEDLLPWIGECECKVEELEITIDPAQLNSSLANAKDLQHDVEKHRSLLEMMNTAADILVDSCQVDEEDIRDEKTDINQRMDLVTEQLQAKSESIEEMAQRLKEFQDSLKSIQMKLDGAKQQLEIYDALGSQAYSNKNLEKLRTRQEALQILESQVEYLRDLARGLVEDTPDGADSSQLLQQAELVQQEYGNVKQRVDESCLAMENRLQGIGHFQNRIREMFSHLADLDDELDSMSPIGRDLDSLQSQTDDIKQFMSKLKKLKKDIETSEEECKQMLEVEGSPDLQGLKRELEALNKQCGKLLERGRNRQEQVETTVGRVEDFYEKLKELNNLLTKTEEGEELQGNVGTEVDIINQQLADFKTFQKVQVDPIQYKLQQANGVGQGLIQSAAKNANTQGLEHDLDEINTRWNTLNKKVAERISQLQEALLHRGKFQDALEPLLSWLTDTEELIANQKPPSAEYKVVKAQIQEQKLLQRLLDDRKSTVEIIKAEGERIAESAETAEKDKIQKQLQNLRERWDGLLNKAAARQKQLDDILVIAKQFHETAEPLNDWLTSKEKKLANSEPVGTQTAKIQQQITRHKALEDDVTNQRENVQQAVDVGQFLTTLSAKPDQEMVEDKLESIQTRYREIRDKCSRKAVLLQQALANAKIFGEEEVEVLNWLADVQDKLSLVTIKDYKSDILLKQHKEQLALNDDIISRKKNVDQAVRNGQALLKQTTGEEVIIIQEKLDGIKSRYGEITTSSSRALKTLEQVLQLATKFQAFNEELCGWLDSVEAELAASTPQSPIGEQIPQLHERQKELKKEVMEYRLVLDTINEVSNALLELVPWRAREGLDRQVAEANERYRTVSDTVTQKVEAIDAAIQRSQQYEQATDSELTWVAETVRKLTALGPIRLEQDQTTAQLQVQKAFSIDIIRHKDSIDELINTQDEILSTCGDEQKTALQEKMNLLQQQYEMVSQMNTERYSQLERAQVLINQFWETYEELCPWLDETRSLIMQLPPPAVDHEILKQQQEEMRQLRESISEHKPHIDKLMKIGPQLMVLNPDEGRMVHEKHTTAEALYAKIKHDARERALALDEAISQSAQFHDKIDPMLESLEHIADRMRMPPSIPAEVEKIREHINENKNIAMELEKLQPSFEALKRRGEELIGRSSGAEEDPAAKAIQDKLDQMVFYWEDIKARGEERDIKLLDVLDLAEKFWYDMAALMTTIKDTQEIVRDLESPGIDPSIIKQQQEAAETIKEETDGLHEELEFVRILGADLIFACGELEKPEVKKSIDELNHTWDNLNKTWKERMDKLEEAMQAAVQYQDALQAMFDWLDNTVIKLGEMSPVGTDISTVKQQINEMKEFKMEVYQQQIEMEKLNHQGELLLKRASDETDQDIIQQPLNELQHLWEDLGEKIINRQHKVEGALLALGQFQHALAELMTWLNHTEELLDGQRPITGDPKAIEIELAKHHVLKNDVLAHKSTVDTVNKAGNELLESSAGEDANNLKHRLDTLNQSWQSLLRKTEGREQQLEAALQQAEGFHGEIEDFLQWLSRVENQLAISKSTGGLPETAREQLNAHLDLYGEFRANEETYKNLHDKGRLLLSSRDDATGSNVEQCVALLEQKWQLMSTKMEERKTKLEEALNLATEFQNSLQDFINWLTQAEQSLNIAAPPSLILDTVLFQIDEHKIFANEVNSHRDQIIDLDKTGNQLKFLSQKQDVVLIKNLLFSVQSRWEKVVQRSVERGRALDEARKRAKQFYEAWKKLIDWLEEAENNLDTDLEISNDPDKIKLQLTKHKDFQKTLGGKQPVYDTTIRMGRSMKDKASHADDRQKLDNLLGEVRDKWDTVCGKSVERQHKLEEALLFSGQFTDALQALVDWLYKVEPQLAEDQPVHGDLDLVMNLMDAHKVFQKELGKRTSSVQVLKRSARELIENSHDDTTWVKVQLQELSIRWDTVCKLSVSKQTRLEQALKQAEEFRNAVHVLLEWLSEAEQSLRFRGVLPDDVEALQSLIDLHKEFMKKVEEKRVDVNKAAGMGEAILAVCHPDCVTTVKHWITIIRARFEEVLTWAKQHQQRLASALSELVTNAELLEELLAWLQWAETTLIQRDQESMPKDIEQVKTIITEHQSFMEEMTRKQPDVDKVTKTYKRKAAEPSHVRGRKPLNQMTNPPAPTAVPAQTEAKNPQINLLSGRWQQVWLLALERQRKLHDCLDRLEELKEFANFDFDVWRKKYMRWMNHKKSRVMDFFRRIDKDQDGKITRQEFIDGILSSKFPTSKLEMTAVADIFDGDGDGYIDYYEFVAALHPNKDAYRPVTDADKIEDEVTRQVAQCKCAKRFQVEQIGENKYRFFLGNQFGDSQQLRLVRILRSTVMVRVGGGWMALDEFLVKNDPCRARGRTNLELREKFILPEGAPQGMAPFRMRGRKSKPSSRAASPTRSSSSASHSNHSCTSMPSSPATPASGNRTPQTFTRCYDKPWLTNSKASTPTKCLDSHVFQIPSIEVTPVQGSKLRRPSYHSSKVSLTGDNGNVPATTKSSKTDSKRTPSRPTSRAGSRAGSRANSRRGSDASDFDVLETQSMCSDISESSTGGSQASSRRGSAKPSKIPTPSKKTTTPKTTSTRR
ncbi:microtubule-actin cross-linking factor 1 isoform X4 [Pristis pectinata]|uniref:microtubule-actin cross-linking factor 1 isoform X4 n=1 Tax=Pristis pectinata TaxID=685728 RepID=UPI00223DC394|nr:microtubule-actin cross-linking factor 1 isoform X4 [Pristis pectinata]